MQVKPTQYIFPPRPTEAIPRDQTEFLGEYGWTAQLKYNDSRCLVKYLPGGEIQLWNRHGERFRDYTAPDWLLEQLNSLREELGLDKDSHHLLDGGLIDKKHRAIKDTIAIWDILVRDSQHLLGTTYQERYNSIHQAAETPWHWQTYKLGLTWDKTPNILLPENWPHQTWISLWEMIDEINAPFTIGKPNDPNYKISPLIEGLVFKDPNGELEMGIREKNNSAWIMRSRVQTGRHLF